jgi:transposase-like protein
MIADSASQTNCPNCRSGKFERSTFQGIAEKLLLRVLSLSPFLCRSCGRRFYLFFAKPEICRERA